MSKGDLMGNFGELTIEKTVVFRITKDYLDPDSHYVRDHWLYFTPDEGEEMDAEFLLVDDDWNLYYRGVAFESILEIVYDYGAAEAGITMLFCKAKRITFGQKRYSIRRGAEGEPPVVRVDYNGIWEMVIG
jgi:hypothetical protein